MLSTLRIRWQSLMSREVPRGRQDRLLALIGRAPPIATAVLALAVAAQIVDITLDLLVDSAVDAPARSTAVRGRMASRGPATPLAALDISRAHLFGTAPIEAAAASRVVSRAPLVLSGIIATGDPTDGFAILGASAASGHVFHTGSEAAPGVMLVEVYPQWVVVLRGSERVTLRLPQAAGSQAVNVRFAGAAAAAPEELADAGDRGAPHPSPEDFKPPPMSNASTILRAFSLRPVSIGGERGVRIMGTGINSGTLSALGLAPGDVIMEVNGVPIGRRDTPNLGKALSGGGVTLIVNRDGGETSVTIDPSAAATAADAYRQAAPDL